MTDEVEEKEVPVLNFNGNSYEMDTLGAVSYTHLRAHET